MTADPERSDAGPDFGTPTRRPYSTARRIEVRDHAEILNYASCQGRHGPAIDLVLLHDEGIAAYYGWPLNQRSGSAAVHAVAHRRGLQAYGIDYSLEQEEPRGNPDPNQLATDLEGIVRTKERSYSLFILVWGAHTHLIERFQSTFYLGFQGKTGSGKGTAIESCIYLTPNGVVLSDASDAYLASVLNEGRAIGLEEWDSLVRKNPGIEALLRNGYRRGATRGIMVQKGQGSKWESGTLSLFGPKVYDTHVGPSGHLLGRSIIIPMEPDDSVDRALDAEKKNDRLKPIRTALALRARQALWEWPQARVDDHLRSVEFRRRVAAMGGRTGRDHVIAMLVLLTCDMMGWDLDRELRPVISGRTTVEQFGLEAEVIETIGRMVGEPSLESELLTTALLAELNRRRQDMGVTGRLTSKLLGGALRELGFKEDVEWGRAKSGLNRDLAVVLPFRVLRECSERLASAPLSDRPSRPSSPSPQDGVGGLGGLGGQSSSPPTYSEVGSKFDPEDLFQDQPTRADRARNAFEGSSGAEHPVFSEPLELTPEIDLGPILAPYGLAPAEAFPGIRFHRVVGDLGRVVLVSRSTARQIGPAWGIGTEPGGDPGAPSP